MEFLTIVLLVGKILFSVAFKEYLPLNLYFIIAKHFFNRDHELTFRHKS